MCLGNYVTVHGTPEIVPNGVPISRKSFRVSTVPQSRDAGPCDIPNKVENPRCPNEKVPDWSMSHFTATVRVRSFRSYFRVALGSSHRGSLRVIMSERYRVSVDLSPGSVVNLKGSQYGTLQQHEHDSNCVDRIDVASVSFRALGG